MSVPVPDISLPRKSAAWKWWVCGLLLLATMLNYMDRLTLNLMASRIMKALDFDELHYGYLESAFASAFAVGAIVFGWMADRWNIRWLYPAAVLAWSLAGFATGLVHGFVGLLVCRFLLGLAEAGNWPNALRTTQHILPPAKRPLGNSILQSGASVGAILTPLIVLALVTDADTDSWRYPFLVIGAIGLAWVVLWLWYVRREDLEIQRKPSTLPVVILSVLVLLLGIDTAVHVEYRDDPALGVLSKLVLTVFGIAAVFAWLLHSTRDDTRLPRPLFLRRYIVLIVLVVTINITWHYFRAWLPLFLQKVHDYSEAEKDWFILLYYVVTDIGTLTAGFVTLQLAQHGLPVHWSRVAVFAVCALLSLLSMAVAYLPAGPLLLGLLLVIGFAALGLFPIYYSFSQEITVQYQGKVTGSLGCINWLAMALLHELVGDSIKRTGSYSEAMALAGVAPALGLLVLLFLWGKTPPHIEVREEGPSGPAPTSADEHIQPPADRIQAS
jgi:ACS family hexuronate transporter-like MFS transporter